MKKSVISLGLIIIFTLYTGYQKTQDSQRVLANAKQEDSAPIIIVEPAPTVNAQPQPTPALKPAPVPIPVSKPQPASVLAPAPVSVPIPVPAPVIVQKPKGMYKDGQYTGDSADAYYGNVQVQIIIQNGKIADVKFLDYPQDRPTSITINTEAMSYLKQEAIQAQNANVDIVSGATATSEAFQQSLASALAQATI